MTTITDKNIESFFLDNDSFSSVDLNSSLSQRPSDIVKEYNKTGPRHHDPYNTDDSTDADTDYNENDVAVTSRRKPSFIQSSLKSFRKRIKTLPDDVNETFTGKKKSKFFCCFRQNT